MSEHNPGTVTAAPYLNHTVLTPAQKEFVQAVAASHSAAHASRLLTQHYLNVLHSCIHTGYKPDEEDDVNATDERVLHHPKALKEKCKKMSSPGRKHSPHRSFKSTSSKQRKMKTVGSPDYRHRGLRIRTLGEDEQDELDDSVIKLLDSLTVGEETVSHTDS